MKKLITLICIVVLVSTVAACGLASDADNTTLPGEDQLPEKPVAPDSSQGLKPEYKTIVDDIMGAIDKGYHASLGITEVKRGGGYLLVGDVNASIALFYISKDGGNDYQVQKISNVIKNVFKDNEAIDPIYDRLMALIQQLEAYSNGSLYEEDQWHSWVIESVDMDLSGATVTLTVQSYLDDKVDQDRTIETYTITEGLLDKYTLTTPYLNSGALSESVYSYLSRGPIDVAELEALYEEIDEFN